MLHCIIMAAHFNVYEAKTQLSKLLDDVAKGKRVVIARANEPVAELVAYKAPQIQLGGFENEIDATEDIDSVETNQAVEKLFEL